MGCFIDLLGKVGRSIPSVTSRCGGLLPLLLLTFALLIDVVAFVKAAYTGKHLQAARHARQTADDVADVTSGSGWLKLTGGAQLPAPVQGTLKTSSKSAKSPKDTKGPKSAKSPKDTKGPKSMKSSKAPKAPKSLKSPKSSSPPSSSSSKSPKGPKKGKAGSLSAKRASAVKQAAGSGVALVGMVGLVALVAIKLGRASVATADITVETPLLLATVEATQSEPLLA